MSKLDIQNFVKELNRINDAPNPDTYVEKTRALLAEGDAVFNASINIKQRIADGSFRKAISGVTYIEEIFNEGTIQRPVVDLVQQGGTMLGIGLLGYTYIMERQLANNKRVVIVHWKDKREDSFEVFSSLKNFCLSYKEYNYNTLSNYLSKRKIAYSNEHIHIERKNVFLKPKPDIDLRIRRIFPVVRKVPLKEANDAIRDLNYWLTQPATKRIAAVTYLLSQSLEKGQRIDKTRIVKRKCKA